MAIDSSYLLSSRPARQLEGARSAVVQVFDLEGRVQSSATRHPMDPCMHRFSVRDFTQHRRFFPE